MQHCRCAFAAYLNNGFINITYNKVQNTYPEPIIKSLPAFGNYVTMRW